MRSKNNFIRTASLALGFLATSAMAFAQDPAENAPPAPDTQQQQQQTGGWRRVGDPPNQNQTAQNQPNYGPYAGNDSQDPNQQGPTQPPPNQPNGNNQPEPPVPSQLTIRPGTYLTVRVNQPLSSDKNQPGDAFTATLVQPLIVDGVVVAQAGQTLGGRVAEAQKAGRVEGTSRLGVQLTDITLVDGQVVPLQTQFITRSGGTSVGRDVAGVGTTTALGAAVGAGAAGGFGAGVGAAAGAAVGTIGVLLTRGHPTVIYPESVLTFRVQAPVTIATDRAPQAFHYVNPEDYSRPFDQGPPPQQFAGSGYAYAPGPYYYPGYYSYWPGYYPYYGFYGPSIGLYYGGFYGRGFYGYRGYYGGFHGGYHGGGGFHGGGHR